MDDQVINGINRSRVRTTHFGGGDAIIVANVNNSTSTNAASVTAALGTASGSVLSQVIGAIKGVQPVNSNVVIPAAK